MVIRALSVFAALMLFAIGAGAAEPSRAPRPDWVAAQDIPAPNPARLGEARDGLYYLLLDKQTRWRDGGVRESYYRVAYKIVERAGLEKGATITRIYDPTHEDLIFHGLRVIRGGAVIDQTAAREFRILRREERLDRGIVNGELTVHVDLEDVRVGDVVDIEVSWLSRPLIAPDEAQFSFTPRYSVPLALQHTRVLWPAGKPVRMRRAPDDPAPTVTSGADHDEYVWTIRDPDPTPGERDTPGWKRAFGRVAMTSAQDWGEVVGALMPRYDIEAVTLPPDFAARVDAIAAETTRADERIARALRLVQDNIRYVGIEIGPGGYIARPPETVVARGYGDCKDKAVLLSASLRRLGVDAAPALADLDRGRDLVNEPPSYRAFDHMIVEARVDGRSVWLDPTRDYQGGRDRVAAPNLGYALPLRRGQTDLAEIAVRMPPAPDMVTTEVFDFAAPGGGVTLDVISVYTGRSADVERAKYARESRNSVSRDYLDFYRKSLPGLQLAGPLTVEDDRDANRLVVNESYHLPAEALTDDLQSDFPMDGSTLTGVLKKPRAPDRRTALWQPYPLHRRHEVVFRNPPRRLNAPKDVDYFGDYFVANSFDRASAKELRVGWTLRTLTPEVPPEDVAAYVADVRQFEDDVTWWYNMSPPPRRMDRKERAADDANQPEGPGALWLRFKKMLP